MAEKRKGGEKPPAEAAPKADPKASAKKKAGKDDPKEPPTEEDLIKYGPSGFKPGTYVEIFGLESADGKTLNDQKGRITKYIYEKIRYEVNLGHKTVSVRPIHLRETEKPDKGWTYGNSCRLVCLRDVEDEALRDANGCLGSLLSRGVAGSWKVISNGKIHSVHLENLRVCTMTEEFLTMGLPARTLQSLAMVVTLHILLGAMIVVLKVEAPEYFRALQPDDDGEEQGAGGSFLVHFLNPTIPSVYVAGLSGLTIGWSFLVLWMTIVCCCVMHRSLWDPLTTFPQIAELSVGRKSATTLYRIGVGMVGALLFASVVLHKELVLPHLPFLGTGVADNVFFWGMAAVAGLAVQAIILVETSYTWRVLVHRCALALVMVAAYKHITTTRALYLPGVPSVSYHWIEMIKEWVKEQIPDRPMFEDAEGNEEERVKAELMKSAQDFGASSKFLADPYVQWGILVRYQVLSHWPLMLCLLPVFSSITERVPENSKVSPASLLRSMFAWLQWLMVVLCSVMLLSYVPDLVVASLLPVPTASDDA